MPTLTAMEARRIALLGQLLAGPPADGIEAVVARLGRVQIDPTAIVERAERLTLWSRLGAYDRDALRALLERPPRRLLEYDARIVPVDDLALHRPAMRRHPRPEYTRGRYVAEWLRDNAAFRRYVLDEIDRRGPLLARDLDDRAEVPWGTGGWNDGKNVGQMLESLAAAGEIGVAHREGGQRAWDRLDRLVPPGDVEELPDEAVAIELMERQLLAAGVVRPGWGTALDYRLPARDVGEASLRADGLAVPVTVAGLPDEWLVHRDLLDALGHAWQPRTTLLGPFDPLIHDRERTLALFGFQYRFELYLPAAKREHGPYALVLLDGDRLAARVDARLDRRAGVLRVHAIAGEPGVPGAAATAAAPLAALAAWLGAELDRPRSVSGRG